MEDGCKEPSGDSIQSQLDLDKCIDENGRPQENIKDLVCTILSLILQDLSSEELSVDLFSQGNYVSESMTYTQTQCHQNNREGHFACNFLWYFATSIAGADIESLVSIAPTCQSDFSKLEVLFTAYYTAMMITICIPASVQSIAEANRYHILKVLTKKAMVCLNIANKFIKSRKESKGKARRMKPGTLETQDNEFNIQTSVGLECDVPNGFALLSELRFISKLLNTISVVDAESRGISQYQEQVSYF